MSLKYGSALPLCGSLFSIKLQSFSSATLLKRDFNTGVGIIPELRIATQKIKFPADLVTFTEEFLNGKIHFLCSVFHEVMIKILIYQKDK